MTPAQFYITHASKADSLTGTAGFCVRAGSTADPVAVRAAFEHPAYELPMDLWAKRPSRDDAPRRLARVRGAGGVWAVHSAYLEKDTMNRDRSYFTHAVWRPAADPEAVVRSWAGPGWVTEYPAGKTKQLPPPGAPADGKKVGRRGLAALLGGPGRPDPAPLSTTIRPARLTADLGRAAVEQFLTAVTLAVADPTGPRARVFVHAEPGVVALLVFAAVRLLPSGMVPDLTFSTYEPPHRGLKDIRHAAVIGTYLGHPMKGLDLALGQTLGYAVDTFRPERSSHELADVPAAIRGLVTAAAAGRWDAVDLGRAADSLPAVAAALQLADACHRLDRGDPTPADLLALAAAPAGRKALEDRPAAASHVYRLATATPAVAAALHGWLSTPARRADLRQRAAAAAAGGDEAGWAEGWGLLARTGGVTAEDLRAVLAAAETVHPVVKTAVRRAASGLLPPDAAAAARLFHPVEPALFADPDLSAAWRAAYIRAGLSDPATIAAAQAALQDAPPDVLAAIVAQAAATSSDPTLAAELVAAPPASVDRLLAADPPLSGDAWSWLLVGFGLPGFDSLTPEQVRLLLPLAGHYPAGQRLWTLALKWVVVAVLDNIEPPAGMWEAVGAAESNGLSAKVSDALMAARLLQAVVADPSTADRTDPADLSAAFATFGLTVTQGLVRVYRGYYRQYQPDRPADVEHLMPFAELFTACWPIDREPCHDPGDVFAEWLAVAEESTADAREAVQRFYFDRFLRVEDRRQLLATNTDPRLGTATRRRLTAELASLKSPDRRHTGT